MDRPRKFAQPLLTEKKSGGEIFLAPALSSDGKTIAFLVERQLPARPGVHRPLARRRRDGQAHRRDSSKSKLDPDFEELRLLYSQSAFSPDGRRSRSPRSATARTCCTCSTSRVAKADRRVRSARSKSVTGPSWSPDGKRHRVQRQHGGITDLYIVNADGTDLRRLTNDRFGDLQPQWSPDGKTIAFASDRDSASFALLKFKPWRITLLDLATGTTTVLPGQAGLNLNPQWAPDGRSIAYISDRTGTANIFLYDLDDARALPADERRRRGLGAHGVQSGDQLGAAGRSTGVHVLRGRRSTRSGR